MGDPGTSEVFNRRHERGKELLRTNAVFHRRRIRDALYLPATRIHLPAGRTGKTVLSSSSSFYASAKALCFRVVCCPLTVFRVTGCLRGLSVDSGWISIKLDTNIHYVAGHCQKGFQGHKVKGQGHS